ncbi:MAG: 2OG-Fe(II) oxygenase [Phenylobacterium sp.]|uniref:2OG-Fe(II) oxygenase n=1 Tax=Phenylobacterium sp. TaxID=1871053 RepID=UPI003918ED6C
MRTYEEVLAAANAGDPASQDLLGQAAEQSGRPQEALQWWARAAKSGYPAAHARIGLWQLVGLHVEQNIGQGVERIIAAARAGDLFGLSLAGVIDAGGVGTPRDPARAIRWLVQAAKAGDAQAGCQLALLAGLDGPAAPMALPALAGAAVAGFSPALRLIGERDARTGSVDLDALGAAVDLAAWDAPLEHQRLNDAPGVWMVPDVLPHWACDYVSALAEPALRRGMVVNEAGGESVEDIRANRVMHFGLVDSDVILELINNRLADVAGMPPAHAEGLGVLHYRVGESYAPHVDYIPETPANAAQLQARGQRVRTVLIYLNEDFEGGATEFPHLGLAFKPPKGSALVFDSVKPDGSLEPLSLHTGASPTRGEKWVISKWFRTRPLRPQAPA